MITKGAPYPVCKLMLSGAFQNGMRGDVKSIKSVI